MNTLKQFLLISLVHGMLFFLQALQAQEFTQENMSLIDEVFHKTDSTKDSARLKDNEVSQDNINQQQIPQFKRSYPFPGANDEDFLTVQHQLVTPQNTLRPSDFNSQFLSKPRSPASKSILRDSKSE